MNEMENKDLLDVPLISQMPELPRGCEVTSLAMVLHYAGVEADKMKLAKDIRRDPTPYEKKESQVYFGHPNKGFVGDMYSFETPGLGVYHEPVADLAREYLKDRIIDLSGQGFQSVLNQLDDGKPVWAINNTWFDFLPQEYWETWQTPEGTLQITYKEHAVVLTGYDDQFVYFNDPLENEKNKKVDREKFIKGWEQMGRQAISYR
ncbi:C39 family peptidase [Scopulibacillus cellulosilyticus]|uniref:C39 family peptidase n=1 Tax=Scopulibacillus cellulosilyticus TaxID=2665665 RepID=A0ABW2PTY4_9BACL